ncbi:MAG TPA: CsbD family protein [Phycisphaerales bacterium]|nr:CsbD family protein [Phycisphaerales bacterium]
MDPDRIDGKADKLKGEVKKGLGTLTGDKSLEAEGHVDKAKGHVKDAFGRVKDEFRAEDRRANEP